MSEAKYKVGQELQTSDGDRHIVEEIRYRYVVKRVYAVPMPGVRPGIGCLNSYDEEELTPYVPPLGVGDRVRHKWATFTGVIDAIRGGKASVWCGQSWAEWDLKNLERIPPEANQ